MLEGQLLVAAQGGYDSLLTIEGLVKQKEAEIEMRKMVATSDKERLVCDQLLAEIKIEKQKAVKLATAIGKREIDMMVLKTLFPH